MNKMKKFLKNNIKLFIGFILGSLLSGFGVYAATIYYNGSNVGYDNTTSGMSADNVQSALDELYSLRTGNAAVGQVLNGYTFSNANGIGLTGTMPNNSTRTSNGSVPGINSNYSNVPTREGSYLQMNTDTSGTKRISICPPAGYYPGGGQSYINRPASDFGNAAASDVVSGKTFTSTAGVKVTGTGAGPASLEQVWSGSTLGNISVNLSSYKYAVIKVTGGSMLMLQVNGSAGWIANEGSSPDGNWGSWVGARQFKATSSGITALSGTRAATENHWGNVWLYVTNVYGVKNLN